MSPYREREKVASKIEGYNKFGCHSAMCSLHHTWRRQTVQPPSTHCTTTQGKPRAWKKTEAGMVLFTSGKGRDFPKIISTYTHVGITQCPAAQQKSYTVLYRNFRTARLVVLQCHEVVLCVTERSESPKKSWQNKDFGKSYC